MSEPTVNGFLASAWRLLGRWRKPLEVNSTELTSNACRALSLARDEAERFNHNFIGTEHILLGLIKLGHGGAFETMKAMGLEPETIRLEIEKIVGVGPPQKLNGSIPWTPRVKKVVALARREAKALNHPQVGTGHLLLGLLDEGDGVAARALRKLDIQLEQTRQVYLDSTARKASAAATAPEASPAPRASAPDRPPQVARPEPAHNLSTGAQLVLAQARREADRFNHNFLGTEHVLLGLLKVRQCVAAKVLLKLGSDFETVRTEIEKQIGIGPDHKMMGNIPYTPRVKKVIMFASREAKSMNCKSIGTGHLLLGLLIEGDGVAGRVLKILGVDLATVRRAMLKEIELAANSGELASSEFTENPAAAGMKREGHPPVESSPTTTQIEHGASETSMNNFTPRARQALMLARKEAIRFNHNFLGTEHVLLGLIKLGSGVAVNVLQKRGLDLQTVRMEVEKQVGAGPGQTIIGNIPYTPRVRKVLELARREAKSLHHTHVGTGHILLALMREGDGVTARVLKELGVDIEKTRREILRELDPNFIFPDESDSSASNNDSPS